MSLTVKLSSVSDIIPDFHPFMLKYSVTDIISDFYMRISIKVRSQIVMGIISQISVVGCSFFTIL